MLRLVYQATGPTDAYLLRHWLERNEIRSFVKGEHTAMMRGQVAAHWPSVWVDAIDETRALEAVRVFNGPELVHPEWQCACGETNPPTFGSCWSCGKEPLE